MIEELKPSEDDLLIYKKKIWWIFSDWFRYFFERRRDYRIKIDGVCSNICFLHTAGSARMLNYKVTVLKDTVGSFNQEAHDFNWKQMKDILGVEIK